MGLGPRETKEARALAVTWSVTVLALFAVLALLGLAMRLGQAGSLEIPPHLFYAFMTLHGLGLAEAMFVGGLAGVWHLLGRYVRLKAGLMKAVYLMTLVGVGGLITATAVGKFAPGWYMLYPLPFIKTWPNWSIGLATASVMVLGVAWLAALLDILRAVSARWGLSNILGWQYFGKPNEAREQLPPIALIASVSALAGSISLLFGAALLSLFLAQWSEPTLSFDPLALKNITFLFGHTLVNVTMYLGLAIVYELLPAFTGRAWKTNRIIVLAWNATLLLVLLAYAHHLYMDFVQPLALQYVGQVASYLSVVPATVVTIFGALAQVYRSGIRWSFVPLAFVLGLTGWVVGGLAAVVDSTIAVNLFFHNTLWVPGHFHTYFVMGYLLLLFAYIYHLIGPDSERTAVLSLLVMTVGGYGFLVMFYIAGVLGVPRRYASYFTIPVESLARAGATTAYLASIFSILLILGVAIYYFSLLKKLRASR